MNRISDIAHAWIPWVGLILGLQVPITVYLTNLGVTGKIVDAIFGGLGIIAALESKRIDSTHDAKVVTAPIEMRPQNLDLPEPPPSE